MALHINIEQLLSTRTIESNRIEFKEGWNPAPIYRTICAFANDFDNIGGGYIVIGIREKDGIAARPVCGLEEEQIDKIQREILQFNNLIEPVYFPKVSIEEIDDRKVLVIWVPGGSNRPYKVPDDVKAKNKTYNYYIRYNSSSIIAKGENEQELISLCNQIPFDDRVNQSATINDISGTLVRDFLIRTKSKLVDQLESMSLSDILARMDLIVGPQERVLPKNVALMLFNYEPYRFFPYTQIDIVIYPEGKMENPSSIIEIPSIKGPVHLMIAEALNYLKTNVIKEKIKKVSNQAEAIKFYNYPYQALEEAVVNALYHRNYQEREPVEIVINPDKIEIISYNGPDRSIHISDLKAGNNIRARRYRNRKLGDYLKELDLTEGRGTGIPTIQKELQSNRSERAVFETDEERTYFLVEIPCHKDFIEPEMREIDREELVNIRFEYKYLRKYQSVLSFLASHNAKRGEILEFIHVSDNYYNKTKYISTLLGYGLIEMTKENLQDPNQGYRITEKGSRYLEILKKEQFSGKE